MNRKLRISVDRSVLRADEIRGLCALVTKIARADLQQRLERSGAGFGAMEHGVLRHLFQGANSMAEISRRMGVAPSTLIYVVDRLAEKGLVRRGRDPRDRRREPLLLEQKGAEMFSRIPGMDMDSVLVQSMREMKEAEQRVLVSLLTKFVSGLPGARQLHQGPKTGSKRGETATAGRRKSRRAAKEGAKQ